MNAILPATVTPFTLTKALLQQQGISIKQAMAGRLRVKVKSLHLHPRQAVWMQKRLAQVFGVRQVESRPFTGSVILFFDPQQVSLKTLLAEIVEQVMYPMVSSAELAKAPPASCGQSCCCTCEANSSSGFSGKLWRTIGVSTFMLYHVARFFLFRLPLIQTPFSLTAAVVAISTLPLAREALADLRSKKQVIAKPFIAVGALITVAMGQAFSALQILWIYNVAELTEEYVARRSRRAIRDILQIAPTNAFILVEGMEVETLVSEIRPGDVVAVHTGERIPVDGLVTEGEALVDEASLNGRSEAVLHMQGHTVYAGTMVSQGTLFICTVKTGEETYLARVMQMVEDSLQNRAPVEQKADQLAAHLLKIGFAATALTLLITLNPLRALTVMLIMSCPCATVLAASSAVTAALANAARHSIMVKGGLFLETVGEADVYCFDKTGTLTMEQPEVIAVLSASEQISADEVLVMAATAESHNQHPLARAILAETRLRDLNLEPHALCEFKAGRGVVCILGSDAEILVGNLQFMEERSIAVTCFADKALLQQRIGNTVVYVAKDGLIQGIIGIANPVRPEAVEVLNNLKADGVKALHLITGDDEKIAQSLLDIFPFDTCMAGLMPEQKAAWVEDLKKDNTVVMVGDGVNDALALAMADLGIAMGAAGAEVALEAADIALTDSDLRGLMKLRNLSHQTMRVIDQNHYLAISTDLIGVTLAMLGILSPVMAGMLHIVHTGGILLNSGRLLSWQATDQPQRRRTYSKNAPKALTATSCAPKALTATSCAPKALPLFLCQDETAQK